jgi:hypothetical protein
MHALPGNLLRRMKRNGRGVPQDRFNPGLLAQLQQTYVCRLQGLSNTACTMTRAAGLFNVSMAEGAGSF